MKACEKATYLKEKSNFSKLSIREWISMKFHFLMCTPCKKYGRDSEKINHVIRKCQHHKPYPEDRKVQLKKKIQSN